jgi:hypothetical protein
MLEIKVPDRKKQHLKVTDLICERGKSCKERIDGRSIFYAFKHVKVNIINVLFNNSDSLPGESAQHGTAGSVGKSEETA